MRRKSRELALQILFQKEFAPSIQVSELFHVYEESFDDETKSFAQELVDGVEDNKEKIDSKIQSVSHHWSLHRMAYVDRNILRIATYELLFTQHPQKGNIIINEAVEIAKSFGTSESAAFVNGILDSLARGA